MVTFLVDTLFMCLLLVEISFSDEKHTYVFFFPFHVSRSL